MSGVSPVDLIAATEKLALRRLQVKYRKPIDESSALFVFLDSDVNCRRVPINLSLIDGWAIYCPDSKHLYYVRRDEVTGRGIRLCPKEHSRRAKRLAADFLNPARCWLNGD